MTEVVVRRATVLPWDQRDPGVSGNYTQDGGGRAKPGVENAGSYSPVAPRHRVAEHRGVGTMTTSKMAFCPGQTSFPVTHRPSCPQPSAGVVPEGSRSPSAAFPLPFLLFRNNGKERGLQARWRKRGGHQTISPSYEVRWE